MIRALLSDLAELLALGCLLVAVACLCVAMGPDQTPVAHQQVSGLIAYAEN